MSQPRSVAMESLDLDTWGPRSLNIWPLGTNFRDPGSSSGWSEPVAPSSGLGMLNSQMETLGLSLKPSPGIQYWGAGFRTGVPNKDLEVSSPQFQHSGFQQGLQALAQA